MGRGGGRERRRRPFVPRWFQLLLQVFLLVKKRGFEHEVFFLCANLFAFLFRFAGAPEHVPDGIAWKTGTLVARFDAVFSDARHEAIGALLMGGASGAAHLVSGHNPVPPANPKPQLRRLFQCFVGFCQVARAFAAIVPAECDFLHPISPSEVNSFTYFHPANLDMVGCI